MTTIPETRFARAGEVDIAHQVVGPGKGIDVVFIPGWVSNLEVSWELPEYAAFLERLAGLGRLILFDKRGTGLSDRISGTATLEERADDIGAVMDAAGSDRAAIVGCADAAAIASMFAAVHPERVSALVLWALALKVVSGSGVPLVPDPAVLDFLRESVESGWGRGILVDVVAPSLAGDERFRAWFRRWERLSATPNAAASLLTWAAQLELAPAFPLVQSPTLVIHRTDAAPFDASSVKAAAGMIPGSTYVELPGADSIPFAGDADALLDEIQEFLTGDRGAPDPDRSLATVLFTDIVGSTEKAEELGDRRWRYLLEEHNARVRRMLDRFRGVEIDTAGDGFFVTFDGPARGIHCACAIRDAVREVGLEVRAGLHTGEVERRGRSLTGIAVHVGARGSSGARERGAGHQHGEDPGPGLGDRLHRPRRPPTEGRPRRVAAVRGREVTLRGRSPAGVRGRVHEPLTRGVTRGSSYPRNGDVYVPAGQAWLTWETGVE